MTAVSAARGGSRGIPTSRAYWDLQAEKLLNRVFEPVETIDLEALEPSAGSAEADRPDDPAPAAAPVAAVPTSHSQPQPQPLSPAASGPSSPREPRLPFPSPAPERGSPAARQRRARRPVRALSGRSSEARPASTARQSDSGASPAPARKGLPQPLLLVAVFAGAGLITATSGVLALSQWNRFQESLQQERNLLLVERLRSFGPAAQPAPASTAATATPAPPTLTPPAGTPDSGGPVDDGGLPPPPPSEPWIQELGNLPQPRPSAPLLRVPVSPALRAAQPATPPRPRTPAGPVPLLVGVVAVPGKPGSAIFQMGGSTSTVSVGDSIGSSGWRLIASDGDGVQIEHQGEVRRISIGGGG